MTLDAEMKRLQTMGLGSKVKQAEPITEEEEELLGDHTPQALLDTMVYMIGLYFALRSGREHRELHFTNSQIQVIQREGERSYLVYTEDSSKNHPGGLRGQNVNRKIVKHHENTDNPKRCFVRLFMKYRALCPLNPKRNAFYFQPSKKPKEKVWFSVEPLSYKKLLLQRCALMLVLRVFGQTTPFEQQMPPDYSLQGQMNN